MERIKLFRDSFQNWKGKEIPKAQLILTDIPYQLGNNMYGSNPVWYKGGDNKNGESALAGKQAFDTDSKAGFRIAEFFHFCSNLLKKEPKKTNDAGCMFLFCAFEQIEELKHYAKEYGFNNSQVFVFYKNYSAQVLKANMRAVGNYEFAVLFYRDKLPKFRNNGKMVFTCQPWIEDRVTPKIHPCFPKDTKVFVNGKWENIQNVKVGDNTNYGVVSAIQENKAEKMVTITVGNETVKATWNHPFLILRNNEIGWVNAEQIKDTDYIFVNKELICTERNYQTEFLQKKDICEQQGIRGLFLTMYLNGKNIMAKFQKECRYIIKTGIRKTITLKTCNLSLPLNISGYTKVADLKMGFGINRVQYVENLSHVQKNIGIFQEGGLMGSCVKNAFAKNPLKQEKFLLQKVGKVKITHEESQTVYNLTVDGVPAFDTKIGVAHNCQKPVPLLENIIRTYTDVDDVVIDCCAGSGSTLLASANLGRRAYGFELKKEYVDGFYEKLYPLIQEDMFVKAEREEKRIKQLEMFGNENREEKRKR